MSFFSKIRDKIADIFAKTNDVESIEDALIEADFGAKLSMSIADKLRKSKDIKGDFGRIVADIVAPYIRDMDYDRSPTIVMMVGVNGVGKTTTVAKLAYNAQEFGKRVTIVACDTFRAAAVDQLGKWATKIGCGFYSGNGGCDPASVAYGALSGSAESDVIIIDTAGRMHNNANLMEELQKIERVINKLGYADHLATIITVDATSGQNTLEQIKVFGNYCKLDGVILSKMDSSAKGGTILNIIDQYKLGIYGVGVGESCCDFERFDLEKFCDVI